MTILATLETVDPVEAAITEHFENPRKAVRRICLEHGVSKTTFYRKLKGLAQLPPKALTPIRVQAPEAPETKPCPGNCGLMIPVAWSDEQILTHWAFDCSGIDPLIERDAVKSLERRRDECQKSTLQNLSLPDSAATPLADTAETTTGLLMKQSNASLPAHDADEWQEYASEVKRGVWDDSPDTLDPYYDKFSPVTGDVTDSWSMVDWVTGITGGIKFSTRNCVTVTHPRRKR